ncbi:tetratricopeptide repeat protein [Chryseobacterium aquaticum]|uniref:Tetratricopeptide repeat protein n=1 Tax=Chryseobacterium aquaticum TaxID=452084 RepID=A0A848N282_9FLAO|nr:MULTISPECIES: tetratricopeptide repeat protein [Chryseobacterium]NMR32868.1 tetratricopeptide repeat protein [Chryseobacterium aquaticum]NRQ45201.1 tetratricopeptide repeat protein [Chryseobacterium sp. C-204]
MKKLILGIAIVSSAFVFGQKQDMKDINAQLQASNKAAMDAYQAKNYAVAAPKFLEVYSLMKTSGQEDKVYMYYAGLSYALANNVDEAIKIYTDLVNSGYTGVQTQYTAKEVKTGEVTSLNKGIWEGLKKAGSKDYTDFKVEQTKSVEPDLYETLSTLLLNAKKNDEALALIEKGLAKYPNNAKLKEYQGSALYATGNTDKFLTNLKEQLAKNPNDATNWYNLGVLQSKAPAGEADAVVSFQKAIQLAVNNPTLTNNAYQNLVYTSLGDDAKAVESINALRKSNPDEATKLIEARKERFNKALPYAEKWYQASPESLDAVTTLREIYGITKNQAKANEMKAKQAELEAKQPK